MKKEINLKDTVWIHLGESSLVEGRVVEIIDFAHLNEGHSPDREFYVIEIKTGIDDIYEVRDYEQISLTAQGPINGFKFVDDVKKARRYLRKVGIKIPDYREDEYEPTPEEITAAIERSQQATKHQALNLQRDPKPKKRYYRKKKQATN